MKSFNGLRDVKLVEIKEIKSEEFVKMYIEWNDKTFADEGKSIGV